MDDIEYLEKRFKAQDLESPTEETVNYLTMLLEDAQAGQAEAEEQARRYEDLADEIQDAASAMEDALEAGRE